MLRKSLALLCLGLACGCSSPSTTPAPGPMISIRAPDGSTLNTTENTLMSGSVGPFQVGVANGKLTIDGKAYGMVKNGDKVKIEKSGEILVNDRPRPPSP